MKELLKVLPTVKRELEVDSYGAEKAILSMFSGYVGKRIVYAKQGTDNKDLLYVNIVDVKDIAEQGFFEHKTIKVTGCVYELTFVNGMPESMFYIPHDYIGLGDEVYGPVPITKPGLEAILKEFQNTVFDRLVGKD